MIVEFEADVGEVVRSISMAGRANLDSVDRVLGFRIGDSCKVWGVTSIKDMYNV